MARSLFALLVLLTLLPLQSRAEERFVIPDVRVVDQQGREVSFYTDLVKDRAVAVTFFYTSCNRVCPTSARKLAAAQELLAKNVTGKVRLISISIDPETDDAARVKSWSAPYQPGQAWTLVTGSNENIQTLLRAFGERTRREVHSPVVVLFDDRTGEWQRLMLDDETEVARTLAQWSGR